VWTSLNQIGTWSGGGTPSKKVTEYWKSKDIMWVTPKDMKQPKVTISELFISLEGLNNSSAKLITKNSLAFVVRSGILRRILPVAIIEKDFAVNQDLQALTLYDFVNPYYALYWTLFQEERIRAKCSKTGTTVESIESHLLKKYPIPLCTRKEQDVLVQQLESLFSFIESTENDIVINLSRVDPLRNSILKWAFVGKLVPQDPTDEPASKLLERIKADKEKATQGEQARKPNKVRLKGT
jgi:type I restriction enzyme, S subunit